MLSLVKVIIEGGWPIDKSILDEIMIMTGCQDVINEYF